MRSCLALIMLLLLALSGFSMSNGPSDESKPDPNAGIQQEIKTEGVNEKYEKITQEELHRIAINYYMYMFSEEHEWKGLKRKDGDGIIKRILPFKSDSVTLAYMVDFNPDGHALILGYKNLGSLILQDGGGHWCAGVKEDYVSITDPGLWVVDRDVYHRIMECLKSGDSRYYKDEQKNAWEKFNVPVEEFKERANFDRCYPAPQWWLEKKNLKNSKNTLGLIQTEWHQYSPFYAYCATSSGSQALVGCTPLAMAQFMKYYSYPINGLEDFSSRIYDWGNMLAFDSLMTDSVYIKPVARICKDAGISVDAIYGTDITQAYLTPASHALTKYFNYTAKQKSMASWYSTANTDEWIDSLQSSMTRGQPVLYGGDYPDVGQHTWLVDAYDYNGGNERFHFNVALVDEFGLYKKYNDWRPASYYISTSQEAIFNAVPDKNENALAMPYKEDFQDVMTGTEIFQIPKNTGVSHTRNGSLVPFFTFTIPDTEDKALLVGNSGDTDQWFVIKKINLACDSVPVLKFSYYIYDQSNLTGSGTDAIIVEVSNDNRITWNQIYKLDNGNYKTSNFKKFIENVVSLNNFKNQIINIRFRLPYSGSSCFCFLDDIEVGLLQLSFPELTYGMTLSPKTAQSVKVSPSIYTPPKSKGFEEFDMIMDFYVKEDIEEADYALAYSDSVLEDGVFEYPDWNTSTLAEKSYKIRAVARTKADSTQLASKEITVNIISPLTFSHFKYDSEGLINSKGGTSLYTTVHKIGADCCYYDNGTYSWVDRIGSTSNIHFYYKYPLDEDFTHMTSAIEQIVSDYNYTYYEIELDTGENKDSVTIKIETDVLINGDTVTLTKEKTFGLIDRYLSFVEPKPVGEGIVDFESVIQYIVESDGDIYEWTDPNFYTFGQFQAEEGFDIDKYKDNTQSTYYKDGQEAEIFNSEGQDAAPANIYNWSRHYYEVTGFPYPLSSKSEGGTGAYMLSVKDADEKEGTGAKELIEYEGTYRFGPGGIIQCKPGLYTQVARNFKHEPDAYIETTHGVKQNFLIPEWKLKNWGIDFRFYPYGFPKMCYSNRVDTVQFCIWRPAAGAYEEPPAKGMKSATTLNVYDYFQSLVYSNSYQCQPETDEIITWSIGNGSLTPGFYTAVATETDPLTSVPVESRVKVQICPLYEHWENSADFFANWKIPIDYGHWGIDLIENTYNSASRQVLRNYQLEAKYSTDAEEKAVLLESNLINTSLYDTMNVGLDFGIGIPATWNMSKNVYEYDELLANYRIEISKDGGESWAIYKQADPEEYRETLENPPTGLTYRGYYYNLGPNVTNVKVRIVKEGLPEYFTTEPDTAKHQSVFFDEIIVKYLEGPILPPPLSPAASVGDMQIKSNSVVLSWQNPVNDTGYELLKYNIYRNGKFLCSVTGTSSSYEDFPEDLNAKYNYAIEAQYGIPGDQSISKVNCKTSFLDCNVWIDLSQYARPSGLEAELEALCLYSNIHLSWNDFEYSSGSSISKYRVYRNGEYAGSTADTTYTDSFLENGEYEYQIAAVYAANGKESISSDSRKITAVSEASPEITEDFQHAGSLPDGWSRDEGLPLIFKTAYEYGNYYIYGGTDVQILGFIGPWQIGQYFNLHLVSKVYDLSVFSRATLSFKYYTRRYDNIPFDFNVCCRQYGASNDTIFDPEITDMSVWEDSGEIEIPVEYLVDDFQIAFQTTFLQQWPSVFQGSVSFDDMKIKGTINSMGDLTISNSSGNNILSWNAIPNATIYYLYRSRYPDKSYQEIGSTTGTSFTDPGADLDDGVYFYKVACEVETEVKVKLIDNRAQEVVK